MNQVTEDIPDRVSVRRLVEEIAAYFDGSDLWYGHGTDNALDEAVYLVFAILGLPFDIADEELDRLIDDAIVNDILHLARQRVEARKPVAYLINKAWFAGLPFYVDNRVLVPRSPIGELIMERYTPWLNTDSPYILDIGTGSGCIAIASALALPDARVDAIDISAEALTVAAINVETYGVESRVNLIFSDLFAGLEGKRYDLIVANPPYVDAPDMAALPGEYRHEPELGLAAGEDGLDIVRRILAGARQHLTDDGVLIVEVGNSRPAVEATWPALPLIWLDFEQGSEGVFLITADALGSVASGHKTAQRPIES